jgi:peptide/nickel transport system substrate-binding protein
LLLIGLAGCGRSGAPATSNQSREVLTVGFGLTSGQNPQAGLHITVENIALEPLLGFGRDGRPQARLADRWSSSSDGLRWHIHLRPKVVFHDGKPLTAMAVREILQKQLPDQLGPAFEDVERIEALSDTELEFVLKRRSSFLLESLDIPIHAPGSSAGTGPFYATKPAGNVSAGSVIEMRANENYYSGKPFVDQILIKPYASVRSAWADMLRGDVDMLYEVGVDELDSLQPSTRTRVFTFQRNYVYVAILNVQKPSLRDRGFRRELNAAIDREALVRNLLKGHGTPAVGPVSPNHWAYSAELPSFRYEPRPVKGGRRFTCLFADASLERLAIGMQQQLRAVGVDMDLELTSLDKFYRRMQAGDFDAVLADARNGPSLLKPYQFWHSGSPNNYGHFSSPAVDAALDSIRHASDDAEYKDGVAAFQRAIIDDPPGIFLAWSHRARAVSTRFEVPVEPGRDVLRTLRLWRPVGDRLQASRN